MREGRKEEKKEGRKERRRGKIGLSTPLASRAGFILTSRDKDVIEYVLRFAFFAANNEAEYKALIIGLKLAKELGAYKLKVFSDSLLVVGQVNGEFEARSPLMTRYFKKVKEVKAHILTKYLKSSRFQDLRTPKLTNSLGWLLCKW